MARTMEELEEAVQQLRLLNADEEVRMLADAEDFAEYDRYMRTLEAREAGRELGITEGEIKSKLKIAKKMKDAGMKIELIKQMTNLTEEEIEKL